MIKNKPSKLSPSPNISRIKSLIKPPPPRTSWELLLDDYLKDPNFKSNLTPKTSQSHKQSTTPSPQPVSHDPFQQTFIPSSNYQDPRYSSCISCQRKSSLPPRRYEMTLDELVYLISQVGRSDLYREMVQYISNISPPHSTNKSSNMNAYSPTKSTESVFFNKHQRKNSHVPSRIQDELIKSIKKYK